VHPLRNGGAEGDIYLFRGLTILEETHMTPQRSFSAEGRTGQRESMDRRDMAERSGMITPGVSVFPVVLVCSPFRIDKVKSNG
jgi:hypothetical protein